MEKIAIAILAAGRGSRFEGNIPKPLVLLEGQSLLSYALQSAQESLLSPIFLAVGYRSQEVAASVPANIKIVYNRDWQKGIASSLRVILQKLQPDSSVGAVCIGLADQPLIGATAYQRLAKAYYQGATLAVATYGGKKRNPVLIARSLWEEAIKLQGDFGAKQLMATHPVLEVICDDTGNPQDIDILKDLQLVKNKM